MDRETRAALKKKWPPKEGRSVDPAATRIDHIGLMTQGHEYKRCPECKGRGAMFIGEEGRRPATDEEITAGKMVEICPKCKGKSRIATYDVLQEVWFGVNESYITQGNRLVLICTGEQASKVDRERIRELEI